MFTIWPKLVLVVFILISTQLTTRAQLFVTQTSSPRTVTLAWDPSPSGSVGYMCLYGNSSDSCTNRLDVGNATMVTLAGMKPNLIYHFTVIAYKDGFQDSNPSNEILYSQPDFYQQSPLGFAPVSPQNYGSTNLLTVSGGSGCGPISYTVLSGPGQIVGGDKLVVTGGDGAVVMVATKAGDSDYYPTSVTNYVLAAKAPQTIRFDPLSRQKITNVVALTASASSGLPVSFQLISGPAILVGNQLSFTGSGAILVAAQQPGDSVYNPAPGVTNTVQVDEVLRPAPGIYQGLFTNIAGAELPGAGMFYGTVTSNGTFSASLQQGLSSLPLTGQIPIDGSISISVGDGTNARTVSLRVESSGADKITGQISASNWTASLTAYRAVYSMSNPASQAGKYTLVMAPGVAATEPGGYGFGNVNVDVTGALALSFTLGDGTTVTQAAYLLQQGLWPFYIPLYQGNGAILGWLTFTNGPDRDIDGILTWTKAARSTTTLYASGFTNQFEVFGSSLDTNASVALNQTCARVVQEGGDLVAPQTNAMRISTMSTSSGLIMMPTTGLFYAKLTNQVTRKVITASGALVQKAQAGYGMFIGGNQTGSVVLDAFQK